VIGEPLVLKCGGRDAVRSSRSGLGTWPRVDVRNLKVGPRCSQISLPATSTRQFFPTKRIKACLHKTLNPGRTRSVQTMMSRRKATILCIDNHSKGLIVRKALLEKNGYEVLEATGGDDGMKLFLDHAVDAVVLDHQTSGMNDDAVAAKMKRFKSHVPIMLLSSDGFLPKDKLGGVDTFLSESQPPKILLSKLQHLLDRPKPFFNRWLDSWKSHNEEVKQ
jgi:CheY-like chemotaxis protein